MTIAFQCRYVSLVSSVSFMCLFVCLFFLHSLADWMVRKFIDSVIECKQQSVIKCLCQTKAPTSHTKFANHHLASLSQNTMCIVKYGSERTNEWTKNHQNKRCKQDISTNYRIWSVNKMKRERKCLVGKTHGKVKLKYNCANAMSWSHRSSNNNKYTPRTHTQCIHLLCFHWKKSTHSTNHEDKWKLVQKTTIRNKSGLLSSLLITY